MKKKPIALYPLQLKFNNQTNELEQLIYTLNSLLSNEASKVYSSDNKVYGIQNPYVKANVQIRKYHTLTKVFPNIVWASTFLTIYSIFEHCLDDLCNLYQKHFKLAISAKDLKDKGIKRSEKYLQKVAQIHFSNSSKDWKEINTAREIRNCLAHSSGVLKESANKEQIEKIVEKDNRLRITNGQLIISMKYVIEVLISCRNIVSDITEVPTTFHNM